MTTEHEIEFKNLLTQAEFTRLNQAFAWPAAHEQTNTYFDTPDFQIKALGGALRIRRKETACECTLKLPHPSGVGLNEFTQQLSLTETDYPTLLQSADQIIAQLATYNINLTDLQCLTSLRTIRRECTYAGGLLVLDQSFYSEIEDFELEFEHPNFTEGQVIFNKLLSEYAIETRFAPSKIKRALLAVTK